MATGKNTGFDENEAPKKADVLIRGNQEISYKQDEVIRQTKLSVSRMDAALEMFSKNIQDTAYLVKQNGEAFEELKNENASLKQELLYLAKQSENIYAGLSDKMGELSEQAKNRELAYGALADKINDVAEQTRLSQNAYADIVDKITELSERTKRGEEVYSELADKVADLTEQSKRNESMYSELSDKMDVISAQTLRSESVFAELGDKINELSEQTRRSENAYTLLSERLDTLAVRVEKLGEDNAKAIATPLVTAPTETVIREEINYDELADKVASAVSAREVISPDYIASKVAEQVIFPDREGANVTVSVDEELIARQVADIISLNGIKVVSENVAPVETVAAPVEPVVQSVTAEIDEESLADRIASKIGTLNVDEDNLADKIADKINTLNLDEDNLAGKIADKINSVNIDEEDLADRIALKVGSLKAEDFEILVDDEGCSSISKEITDKLDYNAISGVIADKLNTVLELAELNAPDYEEMAQRISEKITVAGINEDAIADKAAAVLSNYLPEFDADDISEKVTSAVIDLLNAQAQPVVDNDVICNTISERLIESQADHDYDIVIDEDGISKITELVSEEIEKDTGARFEKIDESIADIKEMIKNGVVVSSTSNEIATAEAAYDNTYAAEEELVTVSDLVKPEEIEEEPAEEAESNGDDEDEEAIEQIEDDMSDGELLTAGFGMQNGVDFENMMKYNRSFIARVIQGSDEQKQFYGAVKQALLSYRKVNSNIAWAAERFNKGRETIARLKIRGKTLCLYLALDPNDYKASVYHHANVIDNKSMNGTPMMVKIKSPLGVKKAIRLIDEMLAKRDGIKREVPERDYAAMYPYETIEELIEDGLVKDVSKNK